ncbi:hypothetical protein [Pareuzebyella sediminis]|uniref:hypothetical protein n=1 Tax=Pareuzebyella sediminis TaxID=2607998 RepID=UPI0011F038FF|nr:hypothetical protein [Pareuzebyella sediminis]
MKKVIIGAFILLLAFIVLTYISVSSSDKTFGTCEILNYDEIGSLDFRAHDSVLVAASTLYQSNGLKEIMQGEQYRKVWATPVKVPIVFLDTLMGGMTVIEKGGGKQTHSLKLRAADGRIYSLRSINKDPEALIPEFAKVLGLENIVVDGISAQHPYAAVVVAKLSAKAGILSTEPSIVFVPRQSILGGFNDTYGNRLFLLEHETEGGTNWTPFTNVSEIVDTDDLQELRKKYGNKVTIDEIALVKARLFDILIGDWDRHAKQWGWVLRKNGRHFKAVPLPGDRDNAFFNIDGLIPTLLANKNVLPGLQSFEKEINYLPGLVMPFDVYFLKKTPLKIFADAARDLQSVLTDDAIEEAFSVWPEEIYRLNGDKIKNTVKYRRDNLVAYAKEFYNELEKRAFLTEPLKGSEDKSSDEVTIACFECD